MFDHVPESKELDLGVDEWPTPYVWCQYKETWLELLNYWNVEYTDDKILFDFNAEFFEMTNTLREKIKERTKIGTKQDLFINFSEFVPLEHEVTVLVFEYFAHKWDFGATFGIGLMKTTKQTPYWLYFLN